MHCCRNFWRNAEGLASAFPTVLIPTVPRSLLTVEDVRVTDRYITVAMPPLVLEGAPMTTRDLPQNTLAVVEDGTTGNQTPLVSKHANQRDIEARRDRRNPRLLEISVHPTA